MKNFIDLNHTINIVHITVSVLFSFTLFMILIENKQDEYNTVIPFLKASTFFVIYWLFVLFVRSIIDLLKQVIK